jgi:glycosyltransferase involved in cell wall biosynthesis
MVYGTSSPVQAGDIGISISKEPLPFRTICGPISGVRVKRRSLSGVSNRRREILWFGLALQTLKQEFFDVVICDYYTRLLSIWPMLAIQHLRKAKFILWGIGFHQIPTPWLDKIRARLVNWSDALLLYSEKESNRYQIMGVPKEKCFVAQNTVDIEGIDTGIGATTQTDVQACLKQLGFDGGPILMHAGRLAANKRLDLLIQSLSVLRQNFPQIKLVLIGEGPEKRNLSNLASKLSISDSVHFLGAITDHKRLAPWVLASDLFVAPAQIGLMAPMCLVYRKTLVISDVLKHHGPEVQAFIPGKTGLTYKYGDVQDLTEKISNLLADPGKRKKFADAGSAHVRDMMGPERMLDAFLAAIHYVTGRQ